LVYEIWYSQRLRDAQTHALTHGRTDPNAAYLRHRFSTVAGAQKFKLQTLISTQPDKPENGKIVLLMIVAHTQTYIGNTTVILQLVL